MTSPADGDVPGDGATAQTHISVLLFLGDRAYKFPKPVRYPFLDQSTPALREEACAEEVRLNRRLAPDVYLGSGRLGLEGEALEHCVVMRRLPEDRRLSTIVAGGGGSDEVRSVARRMAAFHGAAERGSTIDEAGSPGSVSALWDSNLSELAADPDARSSLADLEPLGALARSYLGGRTRLLEARVRAGLICDGHGDLLADDIFCLDDGPRILDCLAFAERYRHGDVLLDLAFLAMDLERLRAPNLARQLIVDYTEFTDEHHPSSLAHHYVAYRALVRAKVAWLRVPDEGATAEGEARALLALSREHLEAARIRLVLVGGPPGTGKSTLARGVGDTLGWSVLSSDEVRKEIGGRGRTERGDDPLDAGLYSPERTDATYAALRDRARHLLEHGESVVLDASWARPSDRVAAAAVAEGSGAGLVEIVCAAGPDTVRHRVRERVLADTDVSDADEVIALRLAERFEPWPTATTIDTEADPPSAAAAAVQVVEQPAD